MGFDVRVENGRTVVRRWDQIFKALSAEPRRQIVASLLDVSPDQPVPLPESAINPNIPPNIEKLREELCHCHLPLLADDGFIDWERERLVASRGPRFEEVAAVMEAMYATAPEFPDSLVTGCQRLERERQYRLSD